MTTSATVLFSGGIDSMCCTHLLREQGHEVSGLYVDYGHDAAACELEAAVRTAAALGVGLEVLEITSSRSFGAGEVTGRNLFLVSAALTFAPMNRGLIAIGIHAGVPYYDCSAVFAKSLSRLVSEVSSGEWGFVAPLLELTKSEIFEYVINNDLPFELSYSCEKGEPNGCGSCLSCLDRKAFPNSQERE